MRTTLRLNYPAPIPVGHTIEITEFAEPPRIERGRWGPLTPSARLAIPNPKKPHLHPLVRDLDTGIRYTGVVPAADEGEKGETSTTGGELPVRQVRTAKVAACTMVLSSGFPSQQTLLELDETED